MSDKTAISWTDATYNPVTGCSKVSPGCEHCFAEALSHRYGWTTKPWTMPNAAENVQLHPDRLDQPLRWRKPRRIFVNSMSDLFHPEVPDQFLVDVFSVMAEASHHTFQILTKRPNRARDFLTGESIANDVWLQTSRGVDGRPSPWPLPNVWLGISAEDQRRADERIPVLQDTPAAVRFISAEPLLGPLDLSAFRPFEGTCYCQDEPDGCKPRFAIDCPEAGIDWVIAGAESGPHARTMNDDWVRSLRDQCTNAGVAFFFKQRCHNGRKEVDPVLDGRQWLEYPENKEGSL